MLIYDRNQTNIVKQSSIKKKHFFQHRMPSLTESSIFQKQAVYIQTCFPSGSGVKNLPSVQDIVQETWIQSLVGKIPWRSSWKSIPLFLSGEAHGPRSGWVWGKWARVHRVAASNMTEGTRHARMRLQTIQFAYLTYL